MDMLYDVEFEIAKLELGPTDVLAVRVAKPIASVVAAELRARLERQLNLAGRVLVLDSDMTLTVVAKSEAAPESRPDTPSGPKSVTAPGSKPADASRQRQEK